MRKRLRKKKHVGEFVQYGFSVDARWVAYDEKLVDKFWDECVEWCVEHGLDTGGGSNAETFGIFCSASERVRAHGRMHWKHGSVTPEQRDAVAAFFASHADVLKDVVVGPLVDAWR